MKSVLPYLGGKSRLSAQITSEIPMDHSCYVEPFCGACWVLLAKEPSRAEVINDADSEDHLQQLYDRLSPPRVTIENLDAIDCIKRYDRKSTFFYIDPPYYETAGYAVPFGHEDHIALADLLHGIKGRFLLSLNDHPEVRKIFKGFKIKGVTLKYSAGNARTSASTRSQERGEVLIRNF